MNIYYEYNAIDGETTALSNARKKIPVNMKEKSYKTESIFKTTPLDRVRNQEIKAITIELETIK